VNSVEHASTPDVDVRLRRSSGVCHTTTNIGLAGRSPTCARMLRPESGTRLDARGARSAGNGSSRGRSILPIVAPTVFPRGAFGAIETVGCCAITGSARTGSTHCLPRRAVDARYVCDRKTRRITTSITTMLVARRGSGHAEHACAGCCAKTAIGPSGCSGTTRVRSAEQRRT
jgi:hypothetical protein